MKSINLTPSVSNGGVSRREALRRAASAGALISLSPLAGFGASTAEAAEEAVGKFPKHPQWKFVFVNHVTTNPFWVPLRYGAEDACALRCRRLRVGGGSLAECTALTLDLSVLF